MKNDDEIMVDGVVLDYSEEYVDLPDIINVKGRFDHDTGRGNGLFIGFEFNREKHPNISQEELEGAITYLLAHELEHAHLFKVLKRLFKDIEIARIGSFFVSDMSIMDQWNVSEVFGRTSFFKRYFCDGVKDIKKQIELCKEWNYPW